MKWNLNYIVKACNVELTSTTGNFENIWINKPSLLTNVFDDVDTTSSCINATDINGIQIRSR